MIISRRLACVGRDQGVAIFNRETIEWQAHLRTILPEPCRPSPVPVPVPVQTSPVVEEHIPGMVTIGDPEPSTVLE
jgi:hypothetical protein